jgi:hypothetical protein
LGPGSKINRERTRESYAKRSRSVDLKHGVMGRGLGLRITQCPYLEIERERRSNTARRGMRHPLM